MANLEQIEQELAALHDQAKQGFLLLHQAYYQYLSILAPLSQQQLITAAYHVCTEIMPERFLKLEPAARQDLQAQIHQISQTLHQELKALLQDPGPTHPKISQTPAEAATETTPAASPAPEKPPEINIEAAIAQILHQAAYGVNRVLQRANILSEFPWEYVLELALKADGHPLGHFPNVMMVMIERRGLDEERRPAKKSNHNSASEPTRTETDSEPEDEPQETGQETSRQQDISEFFQALLKRRFKESDPEEDDQGREEPEDDQNAQNDEDIEPEAATDQDRDPQMLEQEADSWDDQEPEDTDATDDIPSAEDRPIALIAVYLQLEEIEFNHPGLGSQRQQIRQLKNKLGQLEQRMREKFRQRLTLEASRAWRESWPGDTTSASN